MYILIIAEEKQCKYSRYEIKYFLLGLSILFNYFFLDNIYEQLPVYG